MNVLILSITKLSFLRLVKNAADKLPDAKPRQMQRPAIATSHKADDNWCVNITA